MQHCYDCFVFIRSTNQNHDTMKNTFFANRSRLNLSVILLTLGIAAQSVCGQQEERAVSGFEGISYSLPGTLEIVQGTNEGLILQGDEKVFEQIITKVEDGELKIYSKSHGSGLSDVTVIVTVIKLESLAVAGSGEVTIKDILKVNELEFSLSGSGNITCNRLEASETEISIAGSGDMTIGGKVHEVEISVAGSGDVFADNLESEEAEVSIAGSGSVKVWATKELESSIVGSGNVSYRGNPLVEAETSGSGCTKPL